MIKLSSEMGIKKTGKLFRQSLQCVMQASSQCNCISGTIERVRFDLIFLIEMSESCVDGPAEMFGGSAGCGCCCFNASVNL